MIYIPPEVLIEQAVARGLTPEQIAAKHPSITPAEIARVIRRMEVINLQQDDQELRTIRIRQLKGPRKVLPGGTHDSNRYKHGCRCDTCTDAASKDSRDRRRAHTGPRMVYPQRPRGQRGPHPDMIIEDEDNEAAS